GRGRRHPGLLPEASGTVQGQVAMDLGIKGRVALVTGGARSLGKADCLALASEGCKIVVLDLNAEGATETAKEIADKAGMARGFGQTAYATGKMGLVGFAKSVALEGARYNITSNIIAPGIIGPNANLSPMYERMVKRVALQAEGQPEDVASAITFLCSERARYI